MRQITVDGGNGLFVVVMALCSTVTACSTHVPFSFYSVPKFKKPVIKMGTAALQ